MGVNSCCVNEGQTMQSSVLSGWHSLYGILQFLFCSDLLSFSIIVLHFLFFLFPGTLLCVSSVHSCFLTNEKAFEDSLFLIMDHLHNRSSPRIQDNGEESQLPFENSGPSLKRCHALCP